MESNLLIPVKSRILYQNAACVVVNKLVGEAVEGAVGGMRDLREEVSVAINSEQITGNSEQLAMRNEKLAMSNEQFAMNNEQLAKSNEKLANNKEKLGNSVEVIEAVHRLDVPVTGCALFALTKDALSFLNAAFAGDSSLPSPVEKTYWAVIEKPSRSLPESGEFVHYIETFSGKNKSFAHKKDGPGRKKAVLRYRVTGEGRNYLFVEVQLLSGRHHQIRAQFAAEGLHIKGDLKYGAKRSEKGGGIRLHARSLFFPDPLNRSEIIRVTAPPPVMDNLWESFLTTNHTNRERTKKD
jgi:23S rRNA pseudouridine1911/1915/1917 synthase